MSSFSSFSSSVKRGWTRWSSPSLRVTLIFLSHLPFQIIVLALEACPISGGLLISKSVQSITPETPGNRPMLKNLTCFCRSSDCLFQNEYNQLLQKHQGIDQF
uniref:Uncharacterized protein n=1 Tax=Cacopsylla melanoneura TaxID=428564 RepID=A0A8D8ZRB4_9HEMI